MHFVDGACETILQKCFLRVVEWLEYWARIYEDEFCDTSRGVNISGVYITILNR